MSVPWIAAIVALVALAILGISVLLDAHSRSETEAERDWREWISGYEGNDDEISD